MQINVRQGVSEVNMIMWLSVWSRKGKEAQTVALHLGGLTKVS